MKYLALIVSVLSFTYSYSTEYGRLAHIPGYYEDYKGGYFFKHCYPDETVFLIQMDDIKLIIDFLEEKYDTKLTQIKKTKYMAADIWQSIVSDNGVTYELSIICNTRDGINFNIGVFCSQI